MNEQLNIEEMEKIAPNLIEFESTIGCGMWLEVDTWADCDRGNDDDNKINYDISSVCYSNKSLNNPVSKAI